MKTVNVSLLLVSIGLLWISGVLILSRYASLPDIADGFLMGIGIGIMILALIKRYSRSV